MAAGSRPRCGSDLFSAATFATHARGSVCLRFRLLTTRSSPAAAARRGGEGIGVVGWWERDAASVAGCPSSRASLASLDLSSGVSIGRWGAFGAPAFIEGGREGGRVVVVSSPSPRLACLPASLPASPRLASRPHARRRPHCLYFRPCSCHKFCSPFLFFFI